MDKHVLITGGSRGLGRAIGVKFSQSGFATTLLGRTESDLQGVVQFLGDNTGYQVCDLAQTDQIHQAVEQAVTQFGSIDVLINNAGIGSYKPFLEQDPADLEQVIRVNFTGLMHITHIIAGLMKEKGGGQIINIASDLGRRPLANMAVYTATKHALVGFSQSLTRELKSDHIKCMVLTPGIIDTFFDDRQPGQMDAPQALQPDQLAEVVFFMAQQPEFVLIDELSVHPLKQDF